MQNELTQPILESTSQSVADFLKENLPQLIHKFNFDVESDLQILGFENAADTVPNIVMFVLHNMFLIEFGENQTFKFVFLEGEVLTLIAAGLRRNGIVPPLCQIASSKIPLIELLIKVKIYFINFFLFRK